MLMIRRNYLRSRLPKLSLPLNEHISVGKFLQETQRSCPSRNQFLGENFCRFAIRLKLYTTVNNDEPINTQLLQQRFQDAIKHLDLINPNTQINRIKLPSTGQYLSESINKSLNRWKYNAYDEVRNLYKDSKKPDEFIVETVRGINNSLIGWYLQMYGMQNALAFIEWLGVPVFDGNYSWTQPPSPLLVSNNAETHQKLNEILDGYDILEKKLHYQFQDKAYLLQSVTHESFTRNDLTPSYHGLDFVGDAVVNYAIVRHLFRQSQYHFSADILQSIASLLQSNSCLATISVRNEIQKFIRYTTPSIRENINSFMAFLQRNRFKPVNDLYFLDRGNYVFEVPPIIPSNFEALIAAIYFDSKMDINTASNVLLNLMDWDMKTICKYKPKTAYAQLNELDSSAVFSDPVTIASGKIQVTVTLPKFRNKCFNGFSRDAQLAKWAAAKAAVIELKKENNAYIPVREKDLIEVYKNRL